MADQAKKSTTVKKSASDRKVDARQARIDANKQQREQEAADKAADIVGGQPAPEPVIEVVDPAKVIKALDGVRLDPKVSQLLADAPVREGEPAAVSRAREILQSCSADSVLNGGYTTPQRTAMTTITNHIAKESKPVSTTADKPKSGKKSGTASKPKQPESREATSTPTFADKDVKALGQGYAAYMVLDNGETLKFIGLVKGSTRSAMAADARKLAVKRGLVTKDEADGIAIQSIRPAHSRTTPPVPAAEPAKVDEPKSEEAANDSK